MTNFQNKIKGTRLNVVNIMSEKLYHSGSVKCSFENVYNLKKITKYITKKVESY